MQWVGFSVTALILAAVVLWLDRDMRPLHDELWFLCGRSLTDLPSLFLPHNEHWVTLHAAGYLIIAEIFGPASSVPFIAALLGLHVAVAGAVLRLTGSPLAASAMLFFGAGYENLMWGFQIGMVGALALGLWALVAIRENHIVRSIALLTAAAGTQGNGLFFLPAVAAYLAVSRRVNEILWLAVPMIAWIAWAVLERDAINLRGQPPTPTGVAEFASLGIVITLSFGGGLLIAAAHAALVAGGFPWRLTPLAWAALTGLAATFVALALTRAGFSAPESSRYLYLGAPFLIVLIAEIAKTAVRPFLVRSVLASGLVIGTVLLVANGISWPEYVATQRALGADAVPPGVCIGTSHLNIGIWRALVSSNERNLDRGWPDVLRKLASVTQHVEDSSHAI